MTFDNHPAWFAPLHLESPLSRMTPPDEVDLDAAALAALIAELHAEGALSADQMRALARSPDLANHLDALPPGCPA